MSTTSPSLITRLRRHLRVVVLLCLSLVVMKSGIAASCTVDRWSDDAQAAVVLVAGDAHEVAASSASNDDPGTCWHDGTGGCHCVCAHVTPLPPQAPMLRTPPASADVFALAVCDGHPAPLDDHLRPPIA